MRIATFNVFWLGTPEVDKIRRAPDDEQALAQVLRHVDADVFVFQEVVSLQLLEKLLGSGSSGARRYSLRDGEGHWLTTGRMRKRVSHLQKIALAYDTATVELLSPTKPFAARAYPGPRPPIVARLRDRKTSAEILLCGVHLKSGSHLEPADVPESRKRAAECESLVRLLSMQSVSNTVEAKILIGDLNAVREHPSLDPLRTGLPDWKWHEPRYSVPGQNEAWTSFGRLTTIDHVLTSPAATALVAAPPTVYAFDLDPALDRAPIKSGESIHFLRRKTDLVLSTGDEDGSILVENLYRISDHRPLFIDLRL